MEYKDLYATVRNGDSGQTLGRVQRQRSNVMQQGQSLILIYNLGVILGTEAKE